MTTPQLQLWLAYMTINLWIIIPPIMMCMRSKDKSIINKILWIILLGVFNLPAVMIYLFTHKSEPDKMTLAINKAIKDLEYHLIFIGLVLAFEVISLILLSRNEDRTQVLMLLIISVMLIFMNHYLILDKDKRIYQVIPFLQVLAITGVDLFSTNRDFKIIIIVVVLSVLNEYPVRFSKVFSILTLLFYLGTSITLQIQEGQLGQVEMLVYAIRNTITYSLVIISFYIGKKQLFLNHQLKEMTQTLKDKNKELEEISILKERSRIAREIHDTLGHTLTGAIVQLEVARKMVKVDEDKAIEAIDKTQKITRDGFAEVKRAIKALRPIMIEDSSLEEALQALIEKTQNHCQVVIDAKIENDIIQEENVKITIYRIIQEAITNSIRHGEATEIKIRIKKADENAIMIQVTDNGRGCGTISEGYGLKGIKERVGLLGGKMMVHSEYGKGFDMALTLNQKI